MEQGTDLTEAIRWAGQAAVCGTDANNIVQAGLRSIIRSSGDIGITNPFSSARDGVMPDQTRVLLCCMQDGEKTWHVCLKLYPLSAAGQAALHTHARLLRSLKDVVSVPDVIKVLPERDLFGFPALVTTACGQPLDTAMTHASGDLQKRIITRVAEVVSALHAFEPCDSGMECPYDPDSVRNQWQEDVVWYREHAIQAGRYANVVLRGAAVLADCLEVPSVGAFLHRDLTPYNILASGSSIILIDWDHAGFSAPQEDVGKTLIGLLSMLSIPRSVRLQLALRFLDIYSHLRSLSKAELFSQSLPFALDTLLDWVVGGKNAPQEELSWAMEQLLRNDLL
ncbi:MAG: aminoglycoside phosphotransferase family protein [Armatimonadetes bacterium]|nr:aminoglycoside phosphotransferase family protein [Armatimonadota bacterium]